MGMTWRPLGLADATDLTELVAEIEAVDHTGEHYSTEDMAEELADPGLDLAVCSTAILDGSRMIGYGVVRDRSSAERANPAHLDGAIHPAYRRRGLGRQLLDWLLTRAGSMHRDRFPDLPGSVTG